MDPHGDCSGSMMRSFFSNNRFLALGTLCALVLGCGTTKWSDSPRTATEQLLISDAVDRAISEIDFSALANQDVYLDTRYIVTALDQNYVTSTLRQHMLASGCVIKDKADSADYVVEVRSGALGTNRQDLLFGIPATNLPAPGLVPGGSAPIPEIALAKRTNQHAVCKISVFAYDRMTGRPVWQSGNRKVASRAKDTWFLGAGPFQRGNIYDGTAFAGEKIRGPFSRKKPQPAQAASVAVERVFDGPPPIQYAQPAPGGPARAGYIASLPSTEDSPPAKQADSPDGDDAAAQNNPPAEEKAAEPAYTPPPPPNNVPNQPAPGLQGNLTPQSLTPKSNPALATEGAIQTYNWAREFFADGQ